MRWNVKSSIVTTYPWQTSTWEQVISHPSTWGRTFLHSSMFLASRRGGNQRRRYSSMMVTQTWRSGQKSRRKRLQERKFNRSLALKHSKTAPTRQETRWKVICITLNHMSQQESSIKKRLRTCRDLNRWCRAQVQRSMNLSNKRSHLSSWSKA